MKFVVTGGSGFIGSNLANTLVGLDLGKIGQDKKGVIAAVSKSISKKEDGATPKTQAAVIKSLL